MALMQVPARVTALLLTLSSDKNVILFMINILLLVLGCLLDMAPLDPDRARRSCCRWS